GDNITYDIVVTNDGNVTIDNIVVTDDDATVVSGSLNVGTLTPTYSATIKVEHAVTQDDLDSGTFTNVASVSGTDPNDEPVEADDEEPTKFDQNPSLSIVKTVTSTGPYALGDNITYDIVVTNDGNVTIDNIVVTDDDATVVS
ncbi:hypothetical protein SMA90_28280, partial [Escherichia coli]